MNESNTPGALDREELAEFYKWKSGKSVHSSDCATSRAPAYVPGPCDCDVTPGAPAAGTADLHQQIHSDHLAAPENEQDFRDGSALSEAAPPGYVLVPRRPTTAMLEAGLSCHDGSAAPEDELANAYRAMVAVAHPAPAAGDWQWEDATDEMLAALEAPYAYACPAKCGCLWRDNGDGSMSLFGARSQSCPVCEPMPLSGLPPLFTGPARFDKTYCSQCGGEFGPGNEGFSHCEDHAASPAAAAAPDDVWEALQRMIENAASLGPACQEDALLVARWRGQFVAAREAASPAAAADLIMGEPDARGYVTFSRAPTKGEQPVACTCPNCPCEPAADLHQQIMNLRPRLRNASYAAGHRDARHAAAELVAGAAGTAVPEQQWQPIATAPKDVLVDIWIPHADGNGVRWAGAHYDRICDEWRVSTPGERVRWVKASAVSHWRLPPAGPGTPGGEVQRG